MQKSLTKPLAIILVLLILLMVSGPVLRGTAKQVQVHLAPVLAGAISQKLIDPQTHLLPQYGVEFTLGTPQYFEDNDWAVVVIQGKVSTFQSGYAVLHRQSGMYQVVLGPGTSFPNTISLVVPKDVAHYITSQGLVQ